VVCNINADKEISDSLIPPISILTFVENSIKYGAQQQRTLVIDIKIHIIEDYLNISILDNGPGYEENILEQLNSTDANLGKSSIGIENVIKRLKLIYHDKASISFSNDQGACVEIFIPKKPEEDVKL
jgi:two-component system sensor histidine kinase YesM